MNTTEIFLDKYKQLESIATQELHLPPDGSAVSKLEKRMEFKDIRYELNYCRELRNLLAHHAKLEDDFAAVPSQKMIDLIDHVIDRILHPVLAIDEAIPFESLLWKSPKDYVLSTIRIMDERNISHVPIVENRRVIGDFSDNCIFPFILGDTPNRIDENTKFSELSKYMALDSHSSEIFKFVTPDTKLYDVKRMYEDARMKHIRIGMVYITEDGTPEGRLLGALTSWLIVGK